MRSRFIICLLIAVCVSCVACTPPAPQQTPTQHAPDPSDSDPSLTPLASPLKTVLPPGEGDARPVLDLGPAGPTLMFTAALKGYVEPCTCTLDILLGGIDRISGFARSFQALSPSMMIDAGNVLFEDPVLPDDKVPQARLKAKLLVQGLRAMGARSTTPGPYDLTLGLPAYQELTQGLDITALNLTDAQDNPVGDPWRVLDWSGVKVGLVGVLEQEPFGKIPSVKVLPHQAPLTAAMRALDAHKPQARVAVVQGSLAFARQVARDAPELDFIILGLEPRERDEVSPEANAVILEAYSQGRHLGVLKLYQPQTQPADDALFVNARLGSASELKKLDDRIAYLDKQISSAPPAERNNETPIVKKVRAELEQLKQRRLSMSSEGVQIPADAPSFAYFSVPMSPGYPHDVAMYERKQRYNDDLKNLYTQELSLKPVAVAAGQASYAGQAACLSCHEDAHDLWEETKHSLAWATLESKNKTFDPECISCHVTGYAKPGGSIVGAVKGFENVQCEACHGPGSIHIASPDAPGLIALKVPAEVCTSCHDPANSPRFNYDKYLPLILGEGHERRTE